MTEPTPKTAEEIQAMIDEAVSGLKAKNDELIASNKALKADLRKTQEVKPEDLTAAEERADKAEAEAKRLAGELTKAQKIAETAAKSLETEASFTKRLLVENGLREQLAANGVTHAVHQKAAMALLAGQVDVVAEGDTRIAKFGDKALADAVKEWASGDEGKHFVSAPDNSGGGARGGRGGETGKTISESAFNALGAKDRAAHMADGFSIVADKAA